METILSILTDERIINVLVIVSGIIIRKIEKDRDKRKFRREMYNLRKANGISTEY